MKNMVWIVRFVTLLLLLSSQLSVARLSSSSSSHSINNIDTDNDNENDNNEETSLKSRELQFQTPQDVLNIGRDVWLFRGSPSTYQFEFRRICFCDQATAGPNVITVVNGQVVSVVSRDGEYLDTDGAPTILSLFSTIQSAIDRNANDINVSYDGQYGFPTNINIDFDGGIVDEEYIAQVNFFTLNVAGGNPPVAPPVYVPPPVAPPVPPPIYVPPPVAPPVYVPPPVNYANEQAALNFYRNLWYGQSIYYYEFIYTRSCFCPPTPPVLVTVQNGVSSQAGIPTIEELFDTIQDAINDNVFQLQVSYDTDTGYPYYIYIDRDSRIVDEEVSISVSIQKYNYPCTCD